VRDPANLWALAAIFALVAITFALIAVAFAILAARPVL
jgi:hypothetical protein